LRRNFDKQKLIPQSSAIVEYCHKKTSTIGAWILERLSLKLIGPQILMLRSLPFF
jgi:hypothetical protein